MRNLKKFLALVLAMVMAMSLMVTANAATKSSAFPDEDIDEHFVEAVDVLNGLKIFQGQNVTGAEDGKKIFAPKTSITRKEVAALMYRVFSTDVEDDRNHLYEDYGNFTDVSSDAWYAGYVGLCANQEIIKGSNNGRFYPDENVTGYQVLAMMLRMIGYDQNHEFEGTGWQLRVAGLASDLHITDNFNGSNYNRTLNEPATREMVAELIFQSMVRVPMVVYRLGIYDNKTTVMGDTWNPNLGWEKFGLYHDYGWSPIDDWGNPGYKWRTFAGHIDIEAPSGFLWGNEPLPTGTSTTVATIKAEPTMQFTDTKRECDVAHELNYDGSRLFDLWVNQNLVKNYKVEATDTVTRVGGQGRLTKVYYGISSPFAGALDGTVTMVDTYLAQVTRVTPAVLDHNEHVVQYAQADLVVYDRGEAMPGSDRTNDKRTNNVADDTDPINFINDDTYGTRCTNLTKGAYRSEHTLTRTDKNNYSYTVGQYILVQGKTDPSQGNDWTDRTANGDGTGAAITGTNTKTGLNHTGTQAQKEKMAFETNMLDDDDSKLAPVDGLTSVDAKQTSVTWNNGTHNVGTSGTKDDQLTLFMDYAGSNLSNTFTWYFDQNGYLIGIGPKANTVNYGVITSLYSAFEQGSSATTGKAVAMANVTYADGTTGSVAISKFITTGTTNPAGRTGNSVVPSAALAGTANANPYPVDAMTDHEGATAGTNTVELTPVYDYNAGTGRVMQAENNGYTTGDGKAEWGGELYVAPVAQINKDNDKQDNVHYGIIGFNMFKFITTEDGVVTAIEIGGNNPKANLGVSNDNSLRYSGHYHFANSDNAAYKGTLNKAQGNITTEQLQTGAGKGGDPVWLESDVKIILNRNGVLTTYQGLNDLPSNITIKANSEVDWVDTDGDMRADYVYLYGETTGAVTYGLFYYNGGSAVWNGTSGTLTGWLNGTENTTLTFTSEAEFNAVRNSADYYGHMFAVRLMDGVVDELMMTDVDHTADSTTTGEWTNRLLLLNKVNTNGSIVDVDTDIVWGTVDNGTTVTNGSPKADYEFVVGILGGNPYDENTQIAYYSEGRGTPASDTAVAGADITYERNSDQVYGTVTVNNGTGGAAPITYYCGANTKYYGIGMGATHGEAVLEYLEKSPRNDVTIVYDVTNNGILEIYVATDPNITPSDPGSSHVVYSNRQVHYTTTDRNGTESVDHLLLAGQSTYDTVANAQVIEVRIPFLTATTVSATIQLTDGTTHLGYYSAACPTEAAARTATTASNVTGIVVNAGDNVYVKATNSSGTEYVILHIIVESV